HVARFLLDLADEFVAGFLGGEAGDALEFGEVAVAGLVDLGLLAGALGVPGLAGLLLVLGEGFAGAGELGLPLVPGAGKVRFLAADAGVAGFERAGLLVDLLFLLLDAPLD